MSGRKKQKDEFDDLELGLALGLGLDLLFDNQSDEDFDIYEEDFEGESGC